MKSKIIVTLGPSIMDSKKLRQLKNMGVRVFRFNSAHMEISDIKKYMGLIKNSYGSRNDFAVMIDLKGPELRTNDFPTGQFQIFKGYKYKIGEKGEIQLNNNDILKQLNSGNIIYLNDGKIRLKVLTNESKFIITESLDNGILRSKARVNIPGIKLDLGSLTERDRKFLEEGIKQEVDFFALSFTQDEEDAKSLKDIIGEMGGNQLVIAKIETAIGVKNSSRIAMHSDFVMVARGDLGVELPLSEVAVAQKRITREVKNIGRQVILATQILESMVLMDEPTRAEISDITNAVYDGVDSFLLTDETAIGKYPIEAVKFLIDTINYSEKFQSFKADVENYDYNPISFSMGKSASLISDNLGFDIIAFTKNGSTIKIISSMRPMNNIFGLTYNEKLYRQMLAYHNISPILIKFRENYDVTDYIREVSENIGFEKGRKFIVVSGEDYFIFGGTNDVKIYINGEFIGRGQYNGKTICGEFGKDIINYSGNIPSDAKIILFQIDPPNKLRDKLLKSGIGICTNFNFRFVPENGKNVCLDGETGILYY
ncbi:MAG: pyruvate kinase [Thermoplasmatales archaeon]